MTFKELYFCNARWDRNTILTVDIIPVDWKTPRLKHLAISMCDIIRMYSDYALESFKNDWVILREV